MNSRELVEALIVSMEQDIGARVGQPGGVPVATIQAYASLLLARRTVT